MKEATALPPGVPFMLKFLRYVGKTPFASGDARFCRRSQFNISVDNEQAIRKKKCERLF